MFYLVQQNKTNLIYGIFVTRTALYLMENPEIFQRISCIFSEVP